MTLLADIENISVTLHFVSATIEFSTARGYALASPLELVGYCLDPNGNNTIWTPLDTKPLVDLVETDILQGVTINNVYYESKAISLEREDVVSALFEKGLTKFTVQVDY